MSARIERLRAAYPSRHQAVHHELREVLVRAVTASGLSHTAIAERAGVDRSTVSYLLNGRRTGTLDTWACLLGAAGVELGFRLVDRKASA